MDTQNDIAFEQTFTPSSLIKFAFPSIAVSIFTSIYPLVDGFFIKKYTGSIALGVGNLYYPILCIFVSIGTMMGSGGNAEMLKRVGAGDREGASSLFSQMAEFCVLIGLALSAVLMIFAEPIMVALGSTPVNRVFLSPYYHILGGGSTLLLLQSALGSFLIGEGNIVGSAITFATGGILNCVLDYVFMEFFGMGIEGAAIATLIGYSCTTIYSIYYYLIRKKSIYAPRLCRINLKELLAPCANGMSEMVSNLAGGVTAWFGNLLATYFYGEIGVSVLSAIVYYQFIVTSTFSGFNVAVAPIFSYYFGAEEKTKRKSLFKMCIGWLLAISGVIVVLYIFVKRLLVGFYFEPDTFEFNLALKGFGWFISATAFIGINMYASSLFTAFSNGLISAVLSVLRTFVILTVCMFGLSFLLGAEGFWISWAAAELLACAVSAVFMIKYRKRYEYI